MIINRYLLLLVVVLSSGVLSFKGIAQQPIGYSYIYDANQQLVRVIDSAGNVISYVYDAAGNLLQVNTNTTQEAVPVINSVTPAIVNQGESLDILVSGQFFFGGSVSIENQGISFSPTLPTDTEFRIPITISSDATLGDTTLEITTPLGSAQTTITVLGQLPKISTIFPTTGSGFGGDIIQLFGTNFTTDTTVSLNGIIGNVTFLSAGLITIETPPGIAGFATITIANDNGSTTSTMLFLYRTSFTVPGIVSITIDNSSTFTVALLNPAPEDIDVQIAIQNISVASIIGNATKTIIAGENSIDFSILAGDEEKITILETMLAGVSLLTTVFVSPPFTEEIEVMASPVGTLVSPIGNNSFSSVVGTFIFPVQEGVLSPVIGTFISPVQEGIISPIVGTFISPTVVTPLILGEDEIKMITLTLSSPSPIGGICASFHLGNPALVSVPQEVCLAEGEQAFSFDITSIVSGNTTLTIVAGEDRFIFRVISNQASEEKIVSFSSVVGTFISPVQEGVLSSPVGVFIFPVQEGVLSPVAGIEIQ